MTASLCCVSTKNWIFRGQGNFFAVFACRQHKLVLKILKPPEIKNQLLHLQTRIIYRDHVILSLFPKLADYDLDNFFIVKLPSDLLGELNSNPEFAQVLAGVKTAEYGLVAIDLCWKVSHIITMTNKSNRPVLAMELKPKCGVLTSRSSADYPELTNYTRFELNQYLLASSGSKPSKYRPIDLFSRDRILQLSAINTLIEQQQKYLLIYLDGELVYGKDSGDLSTLCRQLEAFDPSFTINSLANTLLAVLNSTVFSSSSALDEIYKWQQLGAVSANRAREAVKSLCSTQIDFSIKNLPDYTEFISRLSLMLSDSSNCHTDVEMTSAADFARLFLLGASGSDVSIFISLTHLLEEDYFTSDLRSDNLPVLTLENGVRLCFSCDVIDADFKGIKTIHKHCNENHKAVTLLRKIQQSSKVH